MGIRVLPGKDERSKQFDVLVCAIGFEARASFFARSQSGRYKKALALAFSERKVLNYSENHSWCVDRGFVIREFDDSLDGLSCLKAVIDESSSERAPKKPVRIVIDVSSMSRPMIASIIRWLSIISRDQFVESVFVYCPSTYVDLGDQLYTTSYIGPVTRAYAGWTTDPRAAVVALVGLGGERGLALGAVEYLEVNDVWAFFPAGVDEKYDHAAERANRELLERIGTGHVIRYSPLNPFDCFCALESLTYGCIKNERPILLPFGPKIFSVVSLLVSEIYRPNVPVWRVSSEQSGNPVDRVANEHIVSLCVLFGPDQKVAIRQHSLT